MCAPRSDPPDDCDGAARGAGVLRLCSGMEIYGVKLSRDLISRVADAVVDDARAWQTRPLQDVYPVVFPNASVLKIRLGGSV